MTGVYRLCINVIGIGSYIYYHLLFIDQLVCSAKLELFMFFNGIKPLCRSINVASTEVYFVVKTDLLSRLGPVTRQYVTIQPITSLYSMKLSPEVISSPTIPELLAKQLI